MKLNALMEQGITKIMKTAGRFYLNNPAGLTFMGRTLPAIRRSAQLRQKHEEEGLHVPPFLIASIASRCNLRCAGCYARAGGCVGASSGQDMDTARWRAVFKQASDLGVSFILLAGGEPLLRRDVMALAAEFPNMIFPVFTNGTMLDEAAIQMLDQCRNMIPVISIEGGEAETDARRGAGTYAQILKSMEALEKRRVLFGASVTVTTENMMLVTDASFVKSLEGRGCGLTLYVEYVPTEAGTEHLVLNDDALRVLEGRCSALKDAFQRMIILSFPGDEQAMGGCLASGRGFFHINPQGGAEPCPFSPHAKQNLIESSMSDILSSGYFADLRALQAHVGHHGGCTLFEHKTQVEYLLAQ
jgi:MoaA/NifB/PqqE/SkfB family radical SAM enzyme